MNKDPLRTGLDLGKQGRRVYRTGGGSYDVVGSRGVEREVTVAPPFGAGGHAVVYDVGAPMKHVLGLQVLEAKAHSNSVRKDFTEVASELRDLLGVQLVAYIGGVRETRAVREWSEGVRVPSRGVIDRLRLAYRVANLIAAIDGRDVAQAWFQGLNPVLQDVSPARALREGRIEDVGAAVLTAARDFAAAA